MLRRKLNEKIDFKKEFTDEFSRDTEDIHKIIQTTDHTFSGTILSLENSGKSLRELILLFNNLLSTDTTPEFVEISEWIAPKLVEHSLETMEIISPTILDIYEKERDVLIGEDLKLLESYYRQVRLSGSGLIGEKKKRFGEISLELSKLSSSFGNNVTIANEENSILITDESILSGIPDEDLKAARERDLSGKGWLFNLTYPSLNAIMKYCSHRPTRERLWRLDSEKCDISNSDLCIRILNLRLELSNLLGYQNYSEMKLEDTMAKNIPTVLNFLSDIKKNFYPLLNKELEEIKKFSKLGEDFQAWDWGYWSEKLKKEKFSVDDSIFRPYFEVNRTQKIIFDFVSELYDIKIEETDSYPKYHSDSQVFSVSDKSGQLGILYTDFYNRPGKRQGAWMTEFRGQYCIGDQNIRPHVSIVMNFGSSLLSFSEVETFLHELGHALHGLFSQCKYETLSGTNVSRDFVELPSQIMENFLLQKEFLQKLGKHHLTGETIPDNLIDNIIESSRFNAGYDCFRQLSFAHLDMMYHTITEPILGDNIKDLEKEILRDFQIFSESKHISTSFLHIFDVGHGYESGYYGYKWAEMLDADAFDTLISINGGKKFRKLLESGNTEDTMELYVKFKGRKPEISSLLKRSGLESH